MSSQGEHSSWDTAFGPYNRAHWITLADMIVSDKQVSRSEAGWVRFASVAFENVLFDNCLLFECSFVNCTFSNCCFHSTVLSGNVGGSVVMKACDIRGSTVDLKPIDGNALLNLDLCTVESPIDLSPELWRFATVSRLVIATIESEHSVSDTFWNSFRNSYRDARLFMHHLTGLRRVINDNSASYGEPASLLLDDLERLLKQSYLGEGN